MVWLIYKITNRLRRKVYVGITAKSLEERWKTHLSGLRKYIGCPISPGTCSALYEAMNADGVEHFSIELIEECSETDERLVRRREREWIRKLSAGFPDGYNLSVRKLTDEQAAIARFDAYHLRQKEYALLFGVSITAIAFAQHPHLGNRGYVSGDPYWYITRDHLPKDPVTLKSSERP